MPTLRARPSRGDTLPDTGKSSTVRRSQDSSDMPAGAIEVRESIEAKPRVDEDAEMVDAGSLAAGNKGSAGDAGADHPEAGDDGNVDAGIDADVDMDADGDVDAGADAGAKADGDAGSDDALPVAPPKDLKSLLALIETTAHYLSNYEEDGLEISAGFQRIPNKRQLPDYFDVIKEPVAFSTIRGKILKKGYSDFGQFVKDVAQICHNAQVYNRPSAPIFTAAVRLRQIFKDKMQEYVSKGMISEGDAELPDLGELPPVEDSPPPGEGGENEDEEAEEDEDEDEDDEDDDDSDEDSGRRRGRRRGRLSTGSRRDRGDDEDVHKKRGRPRRVHTPLEARTHALLKGLRKLKKAGGEQRIGPFEKLPDKAALPDYYTTIRNPICVDQIKTKHKRKKYQSLDEVLADLELMFENAKEYNEEGSEVYEDAVELQKQARALAEQEKAKPDDDFRDEEGRLPLPGIEHKGEIWKVGDWVHIANPNDPRKPIVAQVYRTWQDRAGVKWVNACWYYRPEQTVHRFEKHFYENEVFKTSQYRDHRIEEVDDRCFVMFITRYPKGRPRGFPAGKAVYVCEARYNEERFKFNKINTWAVCLPDEVRDRDYEMDLFPQPHKLRKLPSPIKHLLREDAKEGDPLPKPTWASPNAPPMIGAVHRRPREPNESPPPERTPPPTPAPPPQIRMDSTRRPSAKGDVSMVKTPSFHQAAPVAAASPSGLHYVQQFAPPRATATPTPPVPQPVHHLQPMPPHVSLPHQAQLSQPPQFPPHAYPQQYGVQPMPMPSYQHPPAPMAPAYDHLRAPTPVAAVPPRQPMVPPTPNGTGAHYANAHANQYNMPARPYEVFRILDQDVEADIPEDIRARFHRDDEGRLLFFSAASREPSRTGVVDQQAALGHSISYLASISRIREERQRKRKERDETFARGAEAAKKMAPAERERFDLQIREEGRLLAQGLVAWAEDMDRGTAAIRAELEGWGEIKQEEREERREGTLSVH